MELLLAASKVHPFEATVSVVGTVAAAIVLLTLFFRFLGWWDRRGDGVKSVATSKALSTHPRTKVHIGSGKTIENVRVVGVTDSNAGKGMPWELSGMLILEHEDGSRTLLQAKTVRMIEIPSTQS